MSYSTTKQPNISYQPPDKRRYNRFINPIKVCIEGEWYETVNWSVDAFKIAGYSGDLAEGERVGADIMLVFQGAGITLWREIRVLRSVRKAGILVGRFIDENPTYHDWLIHFCNRLVTGEYQSISEVMSYTGTPVGCMNAPMTEEHVKETFQDRDAEKTTEAKRFSFIYAVAIITVIVAFIVASWLYQGYFFLKTEFAAVSGGTEAITAPFDGVVSDIYVKQGELTEKGQPLFMVINPKIEQEAEFKRNEILKNEAVLEERQKMLTALTSDGTLKLMKAELAKKMLLYKRQLVTEPEVNRLEMEIIKQEGSLGDLQAEVERISKVIKIDKRELAWIEATNERNTVKAAFKGNVKEVPAFEGKFVDEKTPVVVLKALSGEKQVKAYITKLEALQLRLGANAKIEIPSRNLKMKGKLIRLEEEKQAFNRELAVAVIKPESPQLVENIDEGTPIKLTITKRKWF